MKKIITLIMTLFTLSSIAQADTCNCLGDLEVLSRQEGFDYLYAVTRQERQQFIARHRDLAGWTVPLKIESNFRVPLVGSQNYFGRIYFRRGENFIQYRDEQIARRNYDRERRDPSTFMASRYTTAEINARGGYELAPGVRLIGQQFNTTTGGALTISVNGLRVNFQVTVNGNRAIPAAIVNGRRVTFDTMRINSAPRELSVASPMSSSSRMGGLSTR